jgi:hypothetical protein
MQLRIRLLIGCLALLAVPLAAPAQVEEAKANTTPWSGYWWPLWEGRLLGPLGKYDQYTGRRAADYERSHNPPGRGEKWWGYCHAWSAACVMEKEPNRPRTITANGRQITLTVGDMKGLLTAAHSQDASNMDGRRNDGPGIDPDMAPDLVWRVVDRYIKKQGIPVVMDIDPGRQVWNHPCYAYRIESTSMGGDSYRAYMTLWFADDSVPPDYVGTKVKRKTYQFTYRKRGGNVLAGSGRWEGSSVNDHPDFAWYPYLTRSSNPQIDYKKVREMLGLSLAVRAIGDPPPGDPVIQPDNPPQPENSTSTTHQPPALTGTGLALEGAALAPSELATLLVNKTAKFDLEIKTDLANQEAPVGEGYSVKVKSGTAGYLYLFRIDHTGKCSLLFPKVGQDNRVAKNKLTEFGGGAKKLFATMEPAGSQWIKAIVTEKPIRLADLDQQGLDLTQTGSKQQNQQETEFYFNPTTEKQVQEYLRAVFTEDRKADVEKEVKRIKKETGDEPAKVIGDYAQAECVFVVKGKPK